MFRVYNNKSVQRILKSDKIQYVTFFSTLIYLKMMQKPYFIGLEPRSSTQCRTMFAS